MNKTSSRGHPSKLPAFNILAHLSSLEIVKEYPSEYHCCCPVCGDGGFKINKRSGKFNAFKCGCRIADIREAIRPLSQAMAEHRWQKPIRPKQTREWQYYDHSGKPKLTVKRIDNGKGDRTITRFPSGIDVSTLLPYRWPQVENAIANGEYLFIVEGEPCADALADLGLNSISFCGGSNSHHHKACVDLLKPYAEQLVICPDRDQAGLNYAQAIAADYPEAKWCYPYPDSFLWERPPKSSGADIADWIAEGATADIILANVGKRRPDHHATKEAMPNNEKPNPFKRAFHQIEQLYGDRLQFNEFSKEIELDQEPIELANVKVVLAVEENLDLNPDRLDLILQHLAKCHTYHPVKNYLVQCHQRHSNSSILDGLAERYFGCKHLIHNTFLKRTLIAAVARIFQPGAKVDTALILQGKQGLRKSSFFKTLAGADYFDDSLGAISDKDEKLKLHQTWFAEWAELESVLKRKDMAAMKAFLSSSVDVVRPPYGKQAIRMKRQSIIVGTTNQEQFLSDTTGNRRFWIVPVAKRINLEQLQQERDLIWGAAVELYQANEQWWLTPEEELAAQHLISSYQTSDPWESRIDSHLIEWQPNAVTTSEILADCLEIEIGRQSRRDEMRVADCLKRLGWQSTRKIHLGKRQRVWANPDQPRTSESGDVAPSQTVEIATASATRGQPGQL